MSNSWDPKIKRGSFSYSDAMNDAKLSQKYNGLVGLGGSQGGGEDELGSTLFKEEDWLRNTVLGFSGGGEHILIYAQ